MDHTETAHPRGVEEILAEIDETQARLRALFRERAQLTQEPYIRWPPGLREEHLSNCRVLPNRDEMLAFLPKHAVVGEVGTQRGVFAKRILARTQPKRLELIDISFSIFPFDDFDSEMRVGRVVAHEGRSAELLRRFPQGYFDWLYIDADHSYEGVTADIRSAIPALKQDGFLVFNDYTSWSTTEVAPYGTIQAVHELCVTGWKMVFFALHGQGYHDVALRRIQSAG